MSEAEQTPTVQSRLERLKAAYGRLKARFKVLMDTYGKLAFITYLTIFFGTWAAFVGAIKAGFEIDGGAESTGTFVVAYAATKALQPVRIGATLVLTPVIYRLLNRGKDPEKK